MRRTWIGDSSQRVEVLIRRIAKLDPLRVRPVQEISGRAATNGAVIATDIATETDVLLCGDIPECDVLAVEARAGVLALVNDRLVAQEAPLQHRLAPWLSTRKLTLFACWG